ncbi:MAG TPA: 6-phosphofructokinase [Candidatus Bathyarchaeia archaeon]|nr:6-phosphofructokinase [Candidatus Bathyarchaeia archaeon]
MKTIGVITTGGDAPGMNAAIRAVTRVAHTKNLQVIGFKRGWEGLIKNNFKHLTPRSVGGLIQLGGTMLHTARCPEFKTEEGLEKAAKTLCTHQIGGLVVIGGDGSFKGALELSKHCNSLMVGIPATIDNDVYGTDETIGFDTAVNTAVAEIDKIRDTAISHERIFIVEVMGRQRGFLALTVGITVGAEIILVPENRCNLDNVVEILKENARKGKKVGIVVAAEGCGKVSEAAKAIEEQTGSEVRLTILGYVQRGGSPSARSRLLASLFAEKAVELLLQGQGNRVVGLRNGAIISTELEESSKGYKPLDESLLKLAEMLSI